MALGPFNQLNDIEGAKGRFLAFWSAFINASFSFQGTEIVALAAGEARNPRRNVPKAIRRVFWRILFFYIFGVLVIGLTVPYTDANLVRDGVRAQLTTSSTTLVMLRRRRSSSRST